MLELLFLLLPFTVAYGWVMGKHSAKKELQQEQESMNKAFTSSVTLLLKNKEEQALESLIQYLDDNPQSIESYMTMAQIFRKKGEFDKAISIHEGLLQAEQIDLPLYERQLIELELAQDFMSAGMLERALNPLLGILNSEHANQALAMVLHIYEQTREWHAGIDAYLTVNSGLIGEKNRELICHFYCELADSSENVKVKKQAYKRALKVNSSSIRAMVSLAKLYLIVNQKQKSRELIVQALETEPDFAPALFNIAPECFVDEFEQAAWLYWLIKEKNISSVSAHNQLANYIVKEKGLEAGRQYIIDHLQTAPSVRGFAKLIELEQEFFMSKEHFGQLQTLINRYIELKPTYECKSCGFSTNHFSWRCPACNSWQTIKPLTGLDGI
jgi:lipopolysaccharide biosynthesis regulator YciM